MGPGAPLTYVHAMANTATKPVELRRKERVVAAEAMRGVPEGTEGTVTMVSGLSWIRYWVRFDNGVAMGSINRSKLARPEEWQRHLRGEDEPVASPTGGDAVEAAVSGDQAAGGAADVTTPNGTVVPAKLIERAKRARERLSA